ncbi:MAG: hypothetical protein IMY84_05920 [Chloroflexi bacterium]|nr:hypothetical protein [Chloroflexota bacterium]
MAQVLVCGAINWDTTCFVSHLPAPGEEVTCSSVSEVSGGTGANAAVAAARLLGPGRVSLLAALGQDSITQRQLDLLRAEGVSSDAVVRLKGQSSGHAYILVDSAGQNTIASNLGANAVLDVRHASHARLSSLLEDCRCVVLTDPPLAVAAAVVEAASARRISILWDPGVLVSHGWDVLASLAAHADSLVLNEAEAEQLYGTSAPSEIAKRLSPAATPAHLVLKQGGRGSVLLETRSGTTLHIPSLPLARLGLEVVSAVGCGDVFLGAYAAYLALGSERRHALLMASAAGGLNATRLETRGGPDRTSLEDTVHRAASLGFTLPHAEVSDG